jgi:VanZ family protein
MKLRWLPVVIWIGVIVGLSSIPGLGQSRQPFVGADKVVHAIEYGVLGFLFLRALRVSHAASWRAVLLAVLFGVAVGTCDELYQRRVPGRTSDPRDAVADGIGAALGGLLRLRWQRRQGDPQSSSRSR